MGIPSRVPTDHTFTEIELQLYADGVIIKTHIILTTIDRWCDIEGMLINPPKMVYWSILVVGEAN